MKKTIAVLATLVLPFSALAAKPLPFLGDEALREFNCKEQLKAELSSSVESSACHFFRGQDAVKDAALTNLSAQSTKGDGRATYLLGVAAANSPKTTDASELDMAVKFIVKSEEQGFHLAKVFMAQVALAAKEYETAKKLLVAAEEKNVPYANILLSACYNQGLPKVLKPDFKKSCQYAQKASDAGIPDGHAMLGMCYSEGKGVKQDLEKAKALLEKSVSEESVLGQMAAIMLTTPQK